MVRTLWVRSRDQIMRRSTPLTATITVFPAGAVWTTEPAASTCCTQTGQAANAANVGSASSWQTHNVCVVLLFSKWDFSDHKRHDFFALMSTCRRGNNMWKSSQVSCCYRSDSLKSCRGPRLRLNWTGSKKRTEVLWSWGTSTTRSKNTAFKVLLLMVEVQKY